MKHSDSNLDISINTSWVRCWGFARCNLERLRYSISFGIFVGIASYYVLGCVLWLAEAVTSVSDGYQLDQLVAAGSLIQSRSNLRNVSSWKSLGVIDVCGVSHYARWHLWVERLHSQGRKCQISKIQAGFGCTQLSRVSLSFCETDVILCWWHSPCSGFAHNSSGCWIHFIRFLLSVFWRSLEMTTSWFQRHATTPRPARLWTFRWGIRQDCTHLHTWGTLRVRNALALEWLVVRSTSFLGIRARTAGWFERLPVTRHMRADVCFDKLKFEMWNEMARSQNPWRFDWVAGSKCQTWRINTQHLVLIYVHAGSFGRAVSFESTP